MRDIQAEVEAAQRALKPGNVQAVLEAAQNASIPIKNVLAAYEAAQASIPTKNVLAAFEAARIALIPDKKALAAIEAARIASKAMDEKVKQFLDISQQASRIISESMRPLLDSIQKASIGLGENMRKAFEQYGIDEQVALTLLKKYKLFLTPSANIRLVSEIARIGKKKGNHRAEINRLLVRYYCGNNFLRLEEFMTRWVKNDLFRPRMKVLRDCLVVLRNEKRGHNPSNVVLPTLIAQIDGIQLSYLEKRGFVYKRVKGKFAWVDSNGRVEKWPQLYKSITADRKYMAPACEIFVDFLFEPSVRGKRSHITFNRHKIMHGERIGYGRMDNTVRAFLALDFLSYLK